VVAGQGDAVAYGDADTRRKALEGGAEALLTKPIDFLVLRNEIDTGVERLARSAAGCSVAFLLHVLRSQSGPSRHLVRRGDTSASGRNRH
jgi:DNA-binding response OmpR family regulator